MVAWGIREEDEGRCPRGKGVDVITLVWTRVLFRTPCLEYLPQVLSLSDLRLPLALPAGGGGARVVTLAF